MFRHIHIGQEIFLRWQEMQITMERTMHFMKKPEKEIEEMFTSNTLDTEDLLAWCKLLEYDFFRMYSQHLILYSPKSTTSKKQKSVKETQKLTTPTFRKNIYTQEVIDFILDLIEAKEKTKSQIITEYNIPKTTLYKWILKSKKLQQTHQTIS